MYIAFFWSFMVLALYDPIISKLLGPIEGIAVHVEPLETAGAYIAAAICLLANEIENHRAG